MGLELRINPDPAVTRQRISDGFDCVIYDDFLLNPDDAVAHAAERAAEFTGVERAYPGLLLPLSEEDAGPLHAFIRSRLSREFPFLRGGIINYTQFSLATLQPEDMTWIQRLPHSDPRLESGRANYAALLYLFHDPAMGGTGFYRWRDPEFWQEMTTLQADDPDGGLDHLQARFEMFRQPAAYTTESNEAVELLAMVPARYNRLVCYSGDLPHNAFISDPSLLSADPRRGRLTLNCFASVWPRTR